MRVRVCAGPVTIAAIVLVAMVGTACRTTTAGSGEDDPAGASAATPAAPSSSSSSPAPGEPLRFEGGVSGIGPFLRDRLVGRNWHPGCPVGVDDLRHVEVSYWNFNGRVDTGPLIVHESVARDVVWVFRRLFEAGFAIHRIDLPPAYRPPRPEDRFNTRNLTAAFNCRPATGNPGSLSHHSYGWAIDINPLQNPYVRSDGSVLRLAVKPYRDRSLRKPGMIHPGDVVVRSFAKIGWEWGGDWVTLKDYMHFSLTGR
jgi:predicted small secreted protein